MTFAGGFTGLNLPVDLILLSAMSSVSIPLVDINKVAYATSAYLN